MQQPRPATANRQNYKHRIHSYKHRIHGIDAKRRNPTLPEDPAAAPKAGLLLGIVVRHCRVVYA